ncbi:MAG: citrate/2-methylcitrate synthase [Acidimicrobiales bacterium]
MSRNMLTADQVAARLGVKLSTVYAYVSRGVLSRTVASDGKSSRFDAAEVDQLARRGRPRTDARRAGTVDVVMATSLTGILDDRLIYRGHDAAELARTSTLEAVAELLWTGTLPETAMWPSDPAAVGVARAADAGLPESSPLTERLAVITAALACANPLRIDLQPHAVQAHAASLMTTLVAVLPELAGTRPRPPAGDRGRPVGAPTLAARMWPRLSALPANPRRVRVRDAALILLADHELSTSTFAARVAASTRGDPYAVVLSGLGAVSGRLQGAAGHAPFQMLQAARSLGSADQAVAGALATHGSVPGMGHPLYETADPRAACLLELLGPLLSRRDRELIDAVIESASTTSRSRPNIDMATAALAFAMQMSADATEAMFDIARIAGWIAHAIEEYGEAPLRFRARALYTGPPPD